MKNRFFALCAVLAILCAVALAGCELFVKPEPGPEPVVKPTFTPHESAAGLPDRFAEANERTEIKAGGSEFYWADGYSNGGMFDCTWRKRNAEVSDGVMSMSVTRDKSGFAGAEYRTDKKFSYGFYAVCMKAADCSGVISSFFTYTNTPVWDEIDIEFLGKDTGRVQFNYFTNGVGGHEFVLELGFDASKDFHEYAFDFQPGSITWYVDGIAVYRATENIPSHSMQLMANVWNCKGVDEWSGKFDPSSLPATAQYKWIAYPN